MERSVQRKKTNQIDMLHGPLVGKMVLFALPLAASSILQQLFNSADLAVVGRFDSASSMAAVGSNAALVNLIVSLFMGLSVGANVTLGNLIGQGKKEQVNEALHTAIVLALLSGLIILGLGEILAPRLLGLMHTPDEVMTPAVLYLRIFFLAMPFIEVYDFGSAALRSKGDSLRPLYALIASGVLNVILNLVFVVGCGIGVAGVGLATVISNIVSAGLILTFLRNETEEFHLSFRKLRIRKQYLIRMIQIGAPAGLQGMVFSLSNVVIQSAINSFGAAAIAGNTAAQNFEFMAYFVINAFAQTATTFTSQNFAAGNRERCRRVYRLCTLIGMGTTLIVSGVFFAGRYTFIQIFTTDAEVIKFAMFRIAYVCCLECLTGTYEISGGCMRGMGHSLVPASITVLGSCVFRLIWVATVFQTFRSMKTLMLVYPISWVITGTAVTIAYHVLFAKSFRRLRQ